VLQVPVATLASLVLQGRLAQLAHWVHRDALDSLDGLVQQEGQVELVLRGLLDDPAFLEIQVTLSISAVNNCK